MDPYQEIRARGRQLYLQCLTVLPPSSKVMLQAAQRLGIRVAGRTLMVRSEFESNLFQEYLLFEYPHHGKSLISTAGEHVRNLTGLESDILQGWTRSRTSLFGISDAFPDQRQIELQDLLVPESPRLRITDRLLSQSDRVTLNETVLHSRIFSIRGWSMTNGTALLFPREQLPGLLDSTRQKLKRVPENERSEAQFLHFVDKFREFGFAPQTDAG